MFMKSPRRASKRRKGAWQKEAVRGAEGACGTGSRPSVAEARESRAGGWAEHGTELPEVVMGQYFLTLEDQSPSVERRR